MNELVTVSEDIVSALVLNGDIQKLTPPQKVEYYNYRARQAGLDPAAKPFDLLILNGKQVLYANAGGCQQLCSVHKLSTTITHREKVDDIYCVSARVTGQDGRTTENMGSVHIGGMRGEGLANAMMKATTKAIRRTVLAHCGLGMLEESEVETIPGARKISLTDEPVKNLGFSVEEAKGFPLQITDSTSGQTRAYSHHADEDEWCLAYDAMIRRINSSEKLGSDEAKAAARKGLKQANIDLLERFGHNPEPNEEWLADFDGAVE